MKNNVNTKGLSPVNAKHGGAAILHRLAAPALLLCIALLLCGCTNTAKEGSKMPKGPVVFFGDSITFMGRWQSYFPDIEVINLGVSGDKVEDLIDRVDSVIAAKPAKLFIMAGVNDILSGYSVAETAANFERLLDMLPECTVYVQSILPVDSAFGERALSINACNAALASICMERGIDFVDLYALYDDGTGHLAAKYTKDGLHLMPDAYDVWVEEIRTAVEE